MKIKSFDIEGLYHKYSIQSPLDEKINVIVGNNGSFKTTLIKLLKLAAENEEIINSYSVDSVKIEMTTQKGMLVYRQLKGTLENVYAKSQHDDTLSSISEKLEKLILEKKKSPNDIKVGVEQRGYFLDGEEVNKEAFQKELRVDFISTFDVKGGDDKCSLLDKQLDRLQSEYSYYLSDLAKKMTDIIEQKGSISKETLEQINGTKNLMLSFINDAFAPMGKQLLSNQSKLSFALKDGTEINIQKLSAGEKQMLIILLTVLMERNKEYVVLLDEPEISLHIEWQYKLIDMLIQLNPNAQFILSTHSPSIFANGWGDKIIYMEDIVKEK